MDYAVNTNARSGSAGCSNARCSGCDATKQDVQRICGQILQQPLSGDQSLPIRCGSPVRQHLECAFSLFQSLEPVADDRSSSRQRHRLVERVDAYVRSNRDRLVTVPNFARSLSASRRALQICFQEVLGISPARLHPRGEPQRRAQPPEESRFALRACRRRGGVRLARLGSSRSITSNCSARAVGDVQTAQLARQGSSTN